MTRLELKREREKRSEANRRSVDERKPQCKCGGVLNFELSKKEFVCTECGNKYRWSAKLPKEETITCSCCGKERHIYQYFTRQFSMKIMDKCIYCRDRKYLMQKSNEMYRTNGNIDKYCPRCRKTLKASEFMYRGRIRKMCVKCYLMYSETYVPDHLMIKYTAWETDINIVSTLKLGGRVLCKPVNLTYKQIGDMAAELVKLLKKEKRLKMLLEKQNSKMVGV